MALRAYTVATCCLYSVLEYESSTGSVSSAAFAAAAAMICVVSGFPCNSISVAIARRGPLPSPPMAIRADVQEPEAFRLINAPALTTT